MITTQTNNGTTVTMFACTAEQEAFAASLSYWTVLIPWSDQPTKWHPTDRKGPFAVLTSGCYKTLAQAQAWADANLKGQPCTFRWYAFEMPPEAIGPDGACLPPAV